MIEFLLIPFSTASGYIHEWHYSSLLISSEFRNLHIMFPRFCFKIWHIDREPQLHCLTYFTFNRPSNVLRIVSLRLALVYYVAFHAPKLTFYRVTGIVSEAHPTRRSNCLRPIPHPTRTRIGRVFLRLTLKRYPFFLVVLVVFRFYAENNWFWIPSVQDDRRRTSHRVPHRVFLFVILSTNNAPAMYLQGFFYFARLFAWHL